MNHEFSVGIQEMPCLCLIGILPEERKLEQPIFISIFLQGDFSKVASESDLDSGVDYSILQADLSILLKRIRFKLIETAVYCLSHWVLWRYPRVDSVHIELKKPHALGGQGVPVVRLKVDRKRNRTSQQKPFDLKMVIQWGDGALFFERPIHLDSDPSVETLAMADGSELFLQRFF